VAVREVLRLPARALKAAAEELRDELDDRLMVDLIDTMRASPACVGLAAPQIGISKRAVVVDVSSHPRTTVHHDLVALFDPLIVEATGRERAREGCMSVPDLTANVIRATRLTVAGIGRDGSEIVLETEGFEARAFQHEIDHLDGTLILDRVASLTDDVFRRRVYRRR
jgi:peptide deformylase